MTTKTTTKEAAKPVGYAGPPRQRYKSEAQRTWYTMRGYGWVCSRPLKDALVRRHGLTPVEAERVLYIVGKEYQRLLYTGHAVGLPFTPAMYAAQHTKPRFDFKTGKRQKELTTWFTCHATPVRAALHTLREVWINRGTPREQYERHRLVATGRARTRPLWKNVLPQATLPPLEE